MANKPLDINEILGLFREPETKSYKKKAPSVRSPPHPIHELKIPEGGPLVFLHKVKQCEFPGVICGLWSYAEVDGVVMCPAHTMYSLNKIIMDERGTNDDTNGNIGSGQNNQ